MREIQKVSDYDPLVKYKKHFYISSFTKDKVKSIVKNIYELLKLGIIFCLFVLILRKPDVIALILAPTISIASGLLKVIGIIVLIIIIFCLL